MSALIQRDSPSFPKCFDKVSKGLKTKAGPALWPDGYDRPFFLGFPQSHDVFYPRLIAIIHRCAGFFIPSLLKKSMTRLRIMTAAF